MPMPIDDRLMLSDLVHRYASYVDAQRFDDVASLFTTTAQLTLPAAPEHLGPTVRHHGRSEIRSAMGTLSRVVRTHHAIVGEIYDQTTGDDSATGTVAGIAHHWTETDGRFTDTVWYLHYTDEYRRTDAGWRIAQRALSIDAIETRPARHVRT